MQLILDLSPELEAELSAEAARLGLPLTEHALRILSSQHTAPATNFKTGADVVAYWKRENLLNTRPDITDSQAYARKIREEAQRRVRD